jgi:4-amino-4-deoxy-L-arabinose transferase-like glycosyltransferase
VSRFVSCVVLIGIWAAAYLLNLGSAELRSEEGHRVMPAVQMLETGKYLVPYVGTEPYLRKPPLVNWIVAGSFKLFGVRNEWAARFPSALLILSVAITLATFGRVVLGPFGSTMAALCWLTNLGLMEKGRMIEIEALYVSLFAFAFIFWLVSFERNWSPWVTFIVPWIFLGLGLLAKGLLHIVFFYVAVCAVLCARHRLRDLRYPAHLVGILLMLTIFLVWAIPCFHAVYTHSPHRVWLHEIAVAFHGEKDRSENWSLNFPRGFAYFLPWILLVPFIRPSKIADLAQREIVRALAWSITLPFVVVLLIPGTLPRYVLPLVAPFCWIMGIAWASSAFAWSLGFRNFRVAIPGWFIPFCVALGGVAAIVIFPLRSVTFHKRHERLRPIAAG